MVYLKPRQPARAYAARSGGGLESCLKALIVLGIRHNSGSQMYIHVHECFQFLRTLPTPDVGIPLSFVSSHPPRTEL